MTSLRGRLTLLLVAGMGLLLAAGSLVLDRAITTRLLHAFDATLIAKAKSLETLTEQQKGRVWLEPTHEVMPEFEARLGAEYFQLWLADGSVLARSHSLRSGDLPRFGGPLAIPVLRDVTLPDGRHGRLIELRFHPRREKDEPLPDGELLDATLAVAGSREELDSSLSSLHAILVFFVLGLLMATAALVRVSLRVGLAPLNDLALQLDSLRADSLGQSLSAENAGNAPAELAPLLRHLDGLLARLKESFERERAFSENLAHELRTPLAELRALAEVGLRWPEEGSRPQVLAEVRGIALQMERIVLNLLALARCDGNQHTLWTSEVVLEAMLGEAVERCRSGLGREIAETEIELRLDVPSGLTLVTDGEKLALVLSNLFANAVAHGSPGGPVTCSATASGGEIALTVSNPAASLAPEDVPRMFDRFWRKDASRSGGQHAGLGLALVSSLCRLLKLDVEARLTGGVFEITLRGPLVLKET